MQQTDRAHSENNCLRPKKRLFIFVFVGLGLLNVNTAAAACPEGDPCETFDVYRIQSWPMPLEDAAGRDILSLQEANGTDKLAFSNAIKSMASSKSLAIRYRITRIARDPESYCNCNLEHNSKGCHGGLQLETLKQCRRSCRRGTDTCLGTGKDPKQDGGFWYSFPASTEWKEDSHVWKKNTFDVRKNNRDWREEPGQRIIKRAACIATEMKKVPNSNVSMLFQNNSVCPSVKDEELQTEALK